MRTQSHVESESRAGGTAAERAPETMSFRAESLDAAVALAEESLGAPVRVVSANRIRRGGIGGFFASDLGVEVSVALDDETIEQALERLVAESSVDERTRWLEHRAAEVPGASGHGPAALARNVRPPAARTDATRQHESDSVVRLTQRDAEPSMVRVEQIIDELQFLTRHPVERTDEVAGVAPAPRAVVVPTLPPRPSEIARAAATNAAASQAQAVIEEEHLALRVDDPVQHRLPRAKVLAMPSSHQLASPRPPWPAVVTPPAAPTLPVLPAVATRSIEPVMAPVAQSVARPVIEPAPALDAPTVSQREVELAIAATDQLIESLQRESGAKRVSVRVILRTGEQQAVEAEAEWEAQ